MPSRITELRDELMQLFHDIRDESIKTPVAAEMSNAAGKIIASLKVELEYNALKKKEPHIKFLENKE